MNADSEKIESPDEKEPVPAKRDEGGGQEEVGQQRDLFQEGLLNRVLAVEQQRIESTNRRTDVAMQAVKASDESDRRQFEFQMEKLRSEDRAGLRRDGLARTVVWGVGIFVAFVVVLLLGMAFFGTATQSSIAMDILGKIAVGGGGYGIIAGLINLIRRLMKSGMNS